MNSPFSSFKFLRFPSEKNNPTLLNPSKSFQNPLNKDNSSINNLNKNRTFQSSTNLYFNKSSLFKDIVPIQESNDDINSELPENNTKTLKLIRFNNSEIPNYDLSSSFPIEEIISLDFEKIFSYHFGKFSLIEKYLPHMMYQDIENDNNFKNPNIKLILVKFQQILQFLFKMEKNITEIKEEKGKNLKTFKPIRRKLLDKNFILDEEISKNEKKNYNLEKKLDIYNKILINYNTYKPSKPLNNFVLDIHDENNFYYCDLCADLKFNSYKDVQNHYISEHLNILKKKFFNYYNNSFSLKNNNINNYTYEKFYFDNKLNLIKDELKNILIDFNKKGEDDYDNKKMYELRNDIRRFTNLTEGVTERKKSIFSASENAKINTSVNFNSINKMNNSIYKEEYNEDEINAYFNNIEKNQQKYFDEIKKDFTLFKNEIFNQLSNIKNNKPVIVPPKKIISSNFINNDSKVNIQSSLKNISNIQQKNINEININNESNFQKNNMNISNEINMKINDTNKNNNESNLQKNNINIYNEENLIKNKNINDYNINNSNKIFKPSFEKLKEEIDINTLKQNKIFPISNTFNENKEKMKKLYELFHKREREVLFNKGIDLITILDNYDIYNIKQNSKLKNEVEEKLNNYYRSYGIDKINNSKNDYIQIIKGIIINNKNNEKSDKYFENSLDITGLRDEIKYLPNNDENIRLSLPSVKSHNMNQMYTKKRREFSNELSGFVSENKNEDDSSKFAKFIY